MSDNGSIAAEELKAYVARIERLEDEKDGIVNDINEIYKEAKSIGFDTKILRKVVSLRRKDPQEIENEEALVETYKNALGMA